MKPQTLINYLVLGILGVVILGPLVVLFLLSLAQTRDFASWMPNQWGPVWWERLAQQGDVWSGFTTSLTLALLVVLGTALTTWQAAKAMAWNPPRATAWWEAVLLAPAIMPILVTLFGFHDILVKLGLSDNTLGVVLVLMFYTLPYMFRSLQAGYSSLSPRMVEVAHGLGASPLRIFWTVEFPHLLPALVGGSTLVFLSAFSDYLVITLMGGGTLEGIASVLMPALASSQRSWAAVLTLAFLGLPLILLLGSEFLLRRYRNRRNLGS